MELSVRQRYTQTQMLERFKYLAYLEDIAAPTSVLTRCPTLPGTSVSVKEGVIEISVLV